MAISCAEHVISYSMKTLVRCVSQSEPHYLISCKAMRKILKKGRDRVFLMLVRPSTTDDSTVNVQSPSVPSETLVAPDTLSNLLKEFSDVLPDTMHYEDSQPSESSPGDVKRRPLPLKRQIVTVKSRRAHETNLSNWPKLTHTAVLCAV